MRVEAELEPAPVDVDNEPRSRLGIVAAAAEETATATPVWLAAALVALAVAGAVLRLWGLGAHRFNFDESFTAMAGRRTLGDLFAYLRAHDSHPPLDYLLRAPITRLGASELYVRLPSAVCSIGALALFAWWMRRRGVAGVVAVALMAVSAFQIAHGREARMYAEMEPIGVACAVVADAWLRHPRRRHAPTIGAVVLAGLLTHVSMVLVAAGLLAVPGLRRDRDAWMWRAAVATAGAAWAILWGPTFLVQARGGHSSWIPPTSLTGLDSSFGRLVTYRAEFFTVLLLGVVAGAAVLWRRDRRLSTVWLCCFALPAALGAVAGLAAPVVLDRTFTVIAWGPLVALGFLAGEIVRRSRTVGLVAIGALAVAVLPSTLPTVRAAAGPDAAMRQLSRDTRPGDVIVAYPAWRGVEIRWSVAVRHGLTTRDVTVIGLPGTDAFMVGKGRASGRVWMLDWHHENTAAFARCRPTWSGQRTRIVCLAASVSSPFEPGGGTRGR